MKLLLLCVVDIKASPHNCVCGLRPIFRPIRAGIKGGNTYSIPALLSLSYEAKSLAECACQIVRCCLKSAPDAPGRIPNIRPAAKQLFRAKSYCSTPTLYDSRELTCRWHQCTSILTRPKPANSIPTIMQSIILVAPFAMDRQVNIQAVEKPRRRLMRQSSGGCVRGAKSPPRVQSNRILKLF